MITVEHLSKKFKKIHAVDDLSFEARDGEVLGLLGANGAGKTTTTRILSGTLRPSQGRVMIGGYDVSRNTNQVRHCLGVMPELWGLYGHLTPRDHLQFFGRMFGMAPKKINQRVDELVALLQMEEYLDRSCESFSKGMKQKVSMARTMLHNPDHYLLDEPTSGLDVMSARQIRAIVRDVCQQGKCVIMSTHILGEAEKLCDRIVIMDKGRKVAEGTVPELLSMAGAASLEDAFVTLLGRSDVEVQP